MSNIGYAVFGMPKGLAVVSNGLFKTLNLDKSLYLNNVHVVLEKEEQVLMIRRIPSNPNNLEKKDALLVALYENALQYGENRKGGFVGSAICFKDQMPNSDEIISGLTYLFSKMKENVDGDSRFTSIDSSNWNIKLPDANKTFGLENSKLMYSPTTATNKNIVVKLNNTVKEATALLYNFALNRTFHSVDYVYASSSKAVTNKIKTKGFIQVPLAEFFNYNKQLHHTRDIQTKATENLESLKRNSLNLQKRTELYTNELKNLESKFNTDKNSLSNLNKEITEAETKLSQVKNKLRSNYSVPQQVSTSNDKDLYEYKKKYTFLKGVVKNASESIKKDNSHNSDELNASIVKEYFETLPKRQSKNRVIMFSILSVLLIIFLALFIWKSYNFNKYIEETKQKEQVVNNRNAENIKTEVRLNKLKSVEKGSTAFDQKEFYELAKVLLREHLAGKTNKKEKKYINDRKWEFYEFAYTNNKLVTKLNPSSQSTYFISNATKTIKDLSPYHKWKGENEIEKLLKEYQDKNNNDLYQFIDPEILRNNELIVKHFEWMIEVILKKDNRKKGDLTIGDKIKLPFYDLKK